MESPPPAPPVCSKCNALLASPGAVYWLAGGRLLCDACGKAHKPGFFGKKAEGPFTNDRSSVGPGGDRGI